MKALSSLKFWRNHGGRWTERNVWDDQVNEDSSSSDLALVSAGPQLDFDKFVKKNNSSILINATVGITSFDNDTNRHSVHTNLSIRDAQANPSPFNTNNNIFSIQTNLESQSPVLILRSSPKLCVSMLGFKKSEKTEFHCTTTPKKTTTTTEDSKRFDTMKFSVQEVENSSSSNKYLKLIKPLYVKAAKIKIFANGEKQANGNRPVVFREVCKSLMKSKSSVRTVPVAAPAQRRDDSALQQQDGIQSAILHCKRSYSSSSSSTVSQECTVLSRSASESSNQKATINPQVGGV